MPEKEMVSTYEILNYLKDSGCLNILVKKGIVPITFLDYQHIYNFYLKHRENYNKMQAYAVTADDCNVSDSSVRVIVRKMEA
jgi:hypothetical protein